MSPDTRVDDLLSRWQEHRARGEEVTAADLCRECPELLPEVERRLQGLRHMQDSATHAIRWGSWSSYLSPSGRQTGGARGCRPSHFTSTPRRTCRRAPNQPGGGCST
jgi:hypothetical protein